MKISLRFASYAGHGKFSTSIIKNPGPIASNNFQKQKSWERECPHSHEKLTGVKLFCKLLINILLEMPKIIIDHNILLRRSGLRRTGKKMKGCSTNLHESRKEILATKDIGWPSRLSACLCDARTQTGVSTRTGRQPKEFSHEGTENVEKEF